MSLTRNCKHSIKRIPVPYIGVPITQWRARASACSTAGVQSNRWLYVTATFHCCPAIPASRIVKNSTDERVLSPHVADVVVSITPREVLLQRAILRGTTRVCPEIVAKRELVVDLGMAERARMDMMRPRPVYVLAEVEASRRAGNLGIQTLTADPIAKAFHGHAEATNGRGFAQYD